MSRSIKWSLAFMISDWSFTSIWNQYHASYVPYPAHPHGLWWWNQLYLSSYKICISNKCTSGTISNCIKLHRALLLTSWTLSIDHFFYLKRFRDWTLPSSLHKGLFSWAQLLEQVIISREFLPVDGGRVHSLKHCFK
jgi:hypothetical protein